MKLIQNSTRVHLTDKHAYLLELREHPVVQAELGTHPLAVLAELLKSIVQPRLASTSAKLEVDLAVGRLERDLLLPQRKAHQEQTLQKEKKPGQIP